MIRHITKSVNGLKLWNVTSSVTKDIPKVVAHNPNTNNEHKSITQKCKLLFTQNSITIDAPGSHRIPATPTVYRAPLEVPSITNIERKDNNININELIMPSFNKVEEIKAERLIVIRRKKMKKHQLRKLRKRMKYKWAKIRINRKIRKEKAFQAELVAMVKEANNFSVENYVNEKLEKANYEPLPTRWKGRRLPEFIIRQLLGLDKKINYKHTDVYKA